MSKRLLFLDFDGVLNSQPYYQENHEWIDEETRAGNNLGGEAGFYRVWCTHIDPDAVKVLQRIVDETDVDLVISSTWRLRGLEACQEFLRRRGLQDYERILGCTPRGVELHAQCGSYERSDTQRGLEIEWWILRHFPTLEEREDLRIVILDDESDMGRLQPWLVQTSSQEGGLQQHHIEQCKERLTKPVDELLKTPNPLWLPQFIQQVYGEPR